MSTSSIDSSEKVVKIKIKALRREKKLMLNEYGGTILYGKIYTNKKVYGNKKDYHIRETLPFDL